MRSQCPNCKSAFEIEETQLKAADGLVRCGACLHVFNAREQANQNSLDMATSPELDQELESIQAQIDAIVQNRRNPKRSKSLDEEIEDFSKLFSTDPDLYTDTYDDIESFDITNGKPEHFNTSEDFYDQSWTEPSKQALIDDSSPSKDSNTKDKNQKSFQEKDARKNMTPAGLKRRSKLEDDINEFFADSDRVQHQGSGTGSLYTSTTVKQASATTSPPIHIDDEPLSFETAPETLSGRHWLMYSAGTFLISLGLITAVLFSQLDTLSQDPKWRPKLETLCSIIPCNIAPTYSEKFLKVTSLTTAEVNEQIEVNAVIFNTNPHFDMPFPTLIMKFTTLNDELVAEFDIHPDEYRRGELRRIKEFPSNTSAHITFLLPSPGKSAVNYTLSFSYPEA